jgi:3-oxoacyl-[acyl-carrier protein] reductase
MPSSTGAAVPRGSTIARAIAKEGTNVFLAGRRLSSVKEVADEIVDSGGRAEAVLVDAMNESEVNAFVDSMIRQEGTLDLSSCAVDYQVVQNIPLVRLSVKILFVPSPSQCEVTSEPPPPRERS